MRLYLPPFAALVMVSVASLGGCSDPKPQIDLPPPLNPPPEDASTEPPPLVFDPPGPRDPDLAARAAIFLGTCFPLNPEYSIEGFLYEMYYSESVRDELHRQLKRTTACFADKVNGCAALEECTGITPVTQESCNEAGCTADRYDICRDTWQLRLSCKRLGLVCGGFICASYVREPCEPGTEEPCKDGIPHICASTPFTMWKGLHCADYGLACALVANGYPTCVGQGAFCTFGWVYDEIPYLARVESCEGTTLRACINEGEHVMDCGELAKGFSCQSFGTEVFCGLDSACDIWQKPSCEGDSIVFCNAGRIDKIDCKTLGFTGCDPTYGVCTPSPARLL